MAVENPSFETPGIEPGQADQWSESYSDAAEDICDFVHYDGYTRPYEDFEQSWLYNHLHQSAFGLTDIVRALFLNLSMQYETFEVGWSAPHAYGAPFNDASIFVYADSYFAIAGFDAAADAFEDFEEEWLNNENYEIGFPATGSGVLSSASFDPAPFVPEAVEDFEEGWSNNQAAFPVVVYLLTASLFDGGAVPVESFEATWPTVLAW